MSLMILHSWTNYSLCNHFVVEDDLHIALIKWHYDQAKGELLVSKLTNWSQV